jgi:hypothetical protein
VVREMSSSESRLTRGDEATSEQEDELGRLRTERDELEHRVQTLEARPERRRRASRIVSTTLVAIAVLVFAIVVPGTWARRTLLDTDRYVATVAPLAREPAVQEYLARTLTAQLFDALDIQDRLSTSLESRAPRLVFLAGPITTSVEGFVRDRLQTILGSDAFASAWEEANRFVHAQVVAALEGGGETLQVQNGRVVLNLLPLVERALGAMTTLVTDLVGHAVTLPEISANEVPAEAITKLESALGIDLPDRFGTVVVYDSTNLAAVQQGVDRASRLIVLLAVLFAVLAAAAIWVSPRKRRTVLQLATAAAVVLVLERRFAIAEANSLVGAAKPENQAAARAVVDQVLGGLLRYTGWFLAIALVVLLVGLLSGPYPWARRSRRWVAHLGVVLADAVRGRATADATIWVSAHREALMLGGAVVATIVLLVADVSVVGFLVLAALIAVYEVLVYRAGTAVVDARTADQP